MQAKPDLHRTINSFLTSGSTSPAQRDAVRRMLEMVPEREPTSRLLPIDEAAEKLETIKVLEGYWEKHFSGLTGWPKNEFRSFHQVVVATAMMMDIDNFRNLMPRSLYLKSNARTDQFAKEGAIRTLMVMPCFIKKRKSP